jgi:hypothetical protein
VLLSLMLLSSLLHVAAFSIVAYFLLIWLSCYRTVDILDVPIVSIMLVVLLLL